jgi:ribonuclease P protein component
VPAVPPTPGERLPRRETLRASADFQSCYRSGARRSGSRVVLHFRPNQCGHPRLGVTVSRKVGGAVLRHRLKRWTRESFRRSPGRSAVGAFDVVVHFRPEARTSGFVELRSELERLLASLPRGAERS